MCIYTRKIIIHITHTHTHKHKQTNFYFGCNNRDWNTLFARYFSHNYGLINYFFKIYLRFYHHQWAVHFQPNMFNLSTLLKDSHTNRPHSTSGSWKQEKLKAKWIQQHSYLYSSYFRLMKCVIQVRAFVIFALIILRTS